MMMMMMMMIRDAIKKLLVVVVRRPLSSSSASSRPRKTCFFFWACRDSSSCRLYAARDKRNATRFLFPITSDLQKVDSGRDGALERRRRRRPIDTKPRHRSFIFGLETTRKTTFFSRRRRRKKRMRRADETTTRSYGRSKQPRETTLRWDLGSKKDRDGVSKGEKKSVSKQRVLDVESSFFFR